MNHDEWLPITDSGGARGAASGRAALTWFLVAGLRQCLIGVPQPSTPTGAQQAPIVNLYAPANPPSIRSAWCAATIPRMLGFRLDRWDRPRRLMARESTTWQLFGRAASSEAGAGDKFGRHARTAPWYWAITCGPLSAGVFAICSNSSQIGRRLGIDTGATEPSSTATPVDPASSDHWTGRMDDMAQNWHSIPLTRSIDAAAQGGTAGAGSRHQRRHGVLEPDAGSSGDRGRV